MKRLGPLNQEGVRPLERAPPALTIPSATTPATATACPA